MGDKDDLTLYVNGQQLIKGTQITIVHVLKLAKKIYLHEHKQSEIKSKVGMCSSLIDALRIMLSEEEFKNIDIFHLWYTIPKFNRKVAITMFNGNENHEYWWRVSRSSNRIKYFDWLIEQYSKKD